MKRRSFRTVIAAAMIISCICQGTSYGDWIEHSSGWQYQEAGKDIFKDGWGYIENEWYFFDASGNMVTGWQLSCEKWYFLNPISDGTKGKMLTGWQWIDGYCYYFAESQDTSHVKGEMYENEKTPDGYMVDSAGRWTDEMGKVQFLVGKGIITESKNSRHEDGGPRSSGSGSSGSGSSRPGNSESGNGETDNGSQEEKPDLEPATPSEAKKAYTYTIRYMDIINHTVLYLLTGQAEENEQVVINQITIDGYEIHGGQKESFRVSTDGMTVNIYYDPILSASPSEAVKVEWSIFFVERDKVENKIFKTQTGKTEEGKEIIIDFPETIIGTDGYYYDSLVSSPHTFVVSGAGRQKYYIEYERGDKVAEEDPEYEVKEKLKDWLYVTALADEKITGYSIPEDQYYALICNDLAASNERIKNMVSMVQDADPHEIYIIARNHIPNTIIIGQNFRDVINISSLTLDGFNIEGEEYTIMRIRFTRSYDEKTCLHDYVLTDYVPASCTAPGHGSVKCKRCGDEEVVILPPAGHVDTNQDGTCEICYMQIEGNDPDSIHYNIGDVQARRIGGKIYLFRCIDEDYASKTALFLCDNVIRSDIDSNSERLKKLTFGSNNNYKYSYIRTWLHDNAADDLFGAESVLIGTNLAYQGATTEGDYDQFDENELIATDKPFQLLEDKVFILSVDEAIQYREYLWRFGGSEENNQETQYSPYSRGYYLRTPQYRGSNGFEYGTGIYIVDFNGSIHSVEISITDDIGFRPVLAITQQ